MKIYNANKIKKLNSNVVELEGIIKGNMNKVVNNMSELYTAERKSEMMSQLSMQFEGTLKKNEKEETDDETADWCYYSLCVGFGYLYIILLMI